MYDWIFQVVCTRFAAKILYAFLTNKFRMSVNVVGVFSVSKDKLFRCGNDACPSGARGPMTSWKLWFCVQLVNVLRFTFSFVSGKCCCTDMSERERERERAGSDVSLISCSPYFIYRQVCTVCKFYPVSTEYTSCFVCLLWGTNCIPTY